MSLEISYSILRYKHSEFSGEVLNIGVLFIVPALDLIEFHYPKKINRLNAAFPSLNENVIKNYLKSFEKKSKQLSAHISKYSFDYNELLFDQLIVEDSSSLQFDKFRSGIFFGDYKTSIDYYIKLFLGNYNSETEKTEKKLSDTDVITPIKEILNTIPEHQKRHIHFDDSRILRYKKVTFKSDFYWNNHFTHFVRGLSFDLSTESNILEKSLLINGQLRQLEKSELKNSKIDFIVHAPSNDIFYDAFLEAKDILKDCEIDNSIVESHNSSKYGEDIIKSLNNQHSS